MTTQRATTTNRAVTIIGGHGRIALRLAPLLHTRGDEVTSIVRNPDHVAEVERTGATALAVDAESLSVDAIADLLRGPDAVVWSAGAGGGDPERTYAVDRDLAIRTIDAAEKAGVGRFVLVSYLGSGQGHGVPADHPFHAYAQAKADADDHLRASELEWTIVAPGPLTADEPSGRIDILSGDAPGEHHTSRGNVALVIAQVLEAPSTVGRMIEFCDGSTRIAEAVAAK